MKQLLNITIAIPIKNEALLLQGCLDAIGKDFVEKIVIIDSGSTDDSLKIAQRNSVEVLDFKWNGQFPKKRNWFLQNYTPKTKWVLFLDADEYLTEGFKNEIRNAIVDENKVGFWLTYTRYFLGKQMKGGYPLRKLALFQVGSGAYERIEENNWSTLDMEIHEHPILEGKTGVIKSEIDHLDFRGISHYVIKHNEYASWEAERLVKTGNNPAVTKNWTWKQKIKYKLMLSPLIGPIYFVGSYFLLAGFRDGGRGLAFSILKASYFTQVYCKVKELYIK
ncbi:glycosyltransferase family 2 protein [Flavobacterium sp. 120]|uniref:glycosyltransferase family 2 protein n=1 Tax=Flavobacterium sp. 120 TaxID=2135626 RepID=UPI000EAD3DCC|nr:glycosyltransferase family 2 protein [Flavobacterium sp. 120]RKS13311.1 glycosyltransferase involved in cell wall biosynthesis [Flavobacterium sp. 120]